MHSNLNTRTLIHKYREQAKLTQMDLEIELGLSPGVISRIENGQINPKKETLYKILAALNVSPCDSAELLGVPVKEYVTDLTANLNIINQNFDLESLLNIVTSPYLSIFGFKYGIVWIWDEKEKTLKIGKVLIPSSVIAPVEKLLGHKVSEIVYDAKKPEYFHSFYIQSLLKGQVFETSNFTELGKPLFNSRTSKAFVKIVGFKYCTIIPMIIKDKKLGVFTVYWTKEDITDYDNKVLKSFTQQLSATIYTCLRMQELEEKLAKYEQESA